MLRRAEGVNAGAYKRGFFFKKYYYRIWTSKTLFYDFATTAEDWNEMLKESEIIPVCYGKIEERFYWYYAGKWYWEIKELTAEEVLSMIPGIKTEALKE